MKETFIQWEPSQARTRALLDHVQTVIEDYTAQGYQLTLRQLYYQLVSRGLLPNEQRQYKRLGDLVSNARMGGLIDWQAIVDRGRVPIMPSQWSGPGDILRSAAWGYRLDRWKGQEHYVEVWCEKDALSSVLEPICRESHVRFLANKGYSSSSAMYDAAKRLVDAVAYDQAPHVIYLGDHDPSGMDMSRDIEDRLDILTRGEAVQVHRIALNWDQVQEHQPPPNPTKVTDSRAAEYAARYGDESWELDALEPATLDELLRDKIAELLDEDIHEEVIEQEKADKASLHRIARELEER